MNQNLPKLDKESATQIKRRFQAIIDAMDKGKESSYFVIGCPHCEKAYYKAIDSCNIPTNYNCKYCDYPQIEGNFIFQCCMYEFNGVKYSEIKEHLQLSNHDVILYNNWIGKKTKIRAFCQGHINWANQYLENPNESITAETNS